MTTILTVILPTIASTVVAMTLLRFLAGGIERREKERLERLNRESWEVLRATRRIHDETAEALQAMFRRARRYADAKEAREISE